MFCLINGAVSPTNIAALSIKTTMLEGKVTGATGNIWIPLIHAPSLPSDGSLLDYFGVGG